MARTWRATERRSLAALLLAAPRLLVASTTTKGSSTPANQPPKTKNPESTSKSKVKNLEDQTKTQGQNSRQKNGKTKSKIPSKPNLKAKSNHPHRLSPSVISRPATVRP